MTQQYIKTTNPTCSFGAQLNHNEDEIDIRELLTALWKGKWIIVVLTTACAIGGVVFSLYQANIYRAEAVLSVTDDNSNAGALASMASQFGGLASLAGITLGGGNTDNKALAIATLNSRQFLNTFINKHDLTVPLMASKEWDHNTGELILDESLYQSQTSEWVRKVRPGKSVVPTDWENYKKLQEEILSISEDKNTGLITLSITHHSPIIAKQWVEYLVDDLNAWMKQKSLTETKRNIEYLEQQLGTTNIADMRTVFFHLIEEQTKNLMLAEVESEFAFKVIDPAVIPEEKIGPKRALICILVTLLGGVLGVMVVLIRFSLTK